MLQNEKVSVIVPVYKVERYIHRCVNSILSQTYTNIEVILVDDGSPDNCGAIVDNYGFSDSRVKVIHKENGGLSDARNHGMRLTTGEFIMFVDSDDWLESNMIEQMVKYCTDYQADVVQSAFYYAYDDKLLVDKRYSLASPLVLNNQELMYELVINKQVKNFAWGKLYRTKLIKDIPFKKGVLFEDVFWAHHVMHRVERFLLLDTPLYYYFQRGDSIVAAYSLRNLDIIQGLKERHKFIETYYKHLAGESYKSILSMCLIHYNLLALNLKKDKSGVHRKKLFSYIQENSDQFKNAVWNEPELRKQLKLFLLHPYCNILFLGLRKGLRKVKVMDSGKGLITVKEVSGK